MTLENQVTSLEISKRLKDLGVEQESQFSWEKNDPDKRVLVFKTWETPTGISAFSVAELGQMLPKNLSWNSGIDTHKETQYTEDGKELVEKKVVGDIFCTIYLGNGWHYESDENEANARGKMLIYLLENKLI